MERGEVMLLEMIRRTRTAIGHIPFMIGVILALSGMVIELGAEEPPFTERFQRQIVDLRSEHRSVRQRAEAELLQGGDQVLAELPGGIAVSPPPLRSELIQLQRILLIRGGGRDLLGTRITAEPVSLQEAARALSAGGRTPVGLAAGVEKNDRLSPPVQWKDVLFWTALNGLCRDHQLQWRWTDSRSILLEQADLDGQVNADRQTAVVECVRVQGENIRTIPAESGAAGQVQRLNVVVDVEPSVRPADVVIRDADFQLTRGGEPAPLFSPDARRELDFSGQQARFAMNFLSSMSSHERPAMLRGMVRVRCSARREELRFTLADRNDRIEYAGQQEVRLIAQEHSGKSLRVRLQVLFSSDTSRDSHRLGRFHREAWLETTSGTRIPFRAFDLLQTTGALHEIQYEFPLEAQSLGDLSPEELTLGYALPAFTAEMRIPFVLQWEDE